MTEFYLDIDVLQRKRLRVLFQAPKRPTSGEMLKILDSGECQEIIELSTLENIEVEQIKEID